MFVEFLKEYDESAFRNLLISIQSGESFGNAFQEAYDVTVRASWFFFIEHVKREGLFFYKNGHLLVSDVHTKIVNDEIS
jgi:hypothetical protein